ncbi:MAG: hypothetical protein M1834_001119 [Cirrosporium novae-zelandiae]|nr:MAG: hypothetical protein M1834_001119 [Cirrosporium novae-zelandiae]
MSKYIDRKLISKQRGDTPESFERKLSTLSKQISKNTIKVDGQRQRSRRLKVLWTLYISFAYILYSVILTLVVGFKNWGTIEYAAVFSGPLVIYTVRLAFTAFYDFRISSTQAYLDGLHKQRDATIEKLKAATKYNTTQQLLEKYGGAPSSKSKTHRNADRQKGQSLEVDNSPQTPKGGRTGFAPPPTANVPRRSVSLSPKGMAHPSSPDMAGNIPPRANVTGIDRPASLHSHPINEEFAPNAFPTPTQYSIPEQPRWYDRLMDVLLGEDENLPKNRMALICKHCRLVNGQAPPGLMRLEDVGRWKCGGCGGWNGVEDEVRKMVARIKEAPTEDEYVPISKGDESSIKEETSQGSDVEDEGKAANPNDNTSTPSEGVVSPDSDSSIDKDQVKHSLNSKKRREKAKDS